VVRSTGVAKLRESIYLIVGTQPGERVMRPDFGCNLQDLVFAPNNAATADVARHRVSEALRIWEPRIDVEEVDVANENETGSLVVHIRYRIKATAVEDEIQIPVALQQ
jgi:phage baseplate assembly protein W